MRQSVRLLVVVLKSQVKEKKKLQQNHVFMLSFFFKLLKRFSCVSVNEALVKIISRVILKKLFRKDLMLVASMDDFSSTVLFTLSVCSKDTT